jgi:tetratricopeptide (TPR) repeat protein
MYMALGNYAKAQPLVEQALTLAKTNASDSQLSLCLLDLAWFYRDQGRFTDAETMCKQGLELQERSRGKNHPYVAYTLRILGSIYQEQGKYAPAKSVLERAMAIMLKNHSLDDHIVAPFQVDIAKMLVAQGKFAEAEAYYVQARALIDKSYGPNHLYTARVLGNVARLYTLQKRYAEAETLKEQGPEHPLTGKILSLLGRLYIADGKYTEAQEVCQRAVKVLTNSLGSFNDYTAMAFNNLAKLYAHQGNYDAAQAPSRWTLDNLDQIVDLPIGTGPLTKFLLVYMLNPIRSLPLATHRKHPCA